MYFNIMSFYNSNTFYINKRMQEYLKYYQNKIIKSYIKKHNETKYIPSLLMQTLPPLDPNNYIKIIPMTYILSFLAGYYSHYFLKM